MDNIALKWTRRYKSTVNTSRNKLKEKLESAQFFLNFFRSCPFFAYFLAEKVSVFCLRFGKISPFEEFSTLHQRFLFILKGPLG